MTVPTPPIRVLIADDNRQVRRGLRLMLEHADGIHVIGEASNGADAVAAARAERAQVVLMDLQMPGMTGLDATRALARLAAEESASAPAVIVMTSYSVDQYVLDALDAGAAGYLLKSSDSDLVVPAIRAAARGDALVSSRVTAPVLAELKRRRSSAPDDGETARLAPAELRIVSALVAGITRNEEIAAHLHLSVHTVRSQVKSALRKLQLGDRTQLALWGVRNADALGDDRPKG
ncbi:response regulator [Microbacterium sp. RD1]|uniref:response regulator n=1 Tax=Microbacterium sp. RD1 TaxID=3457313 RepID=UPI003FA5579B